MFHTYDEHPLMAQQIAKLARTLVPFEYTSRFHQALRALEVKAFGPWVPGDGRRDPTLHNAASDACWEWLNIIAETAAELALTVSTFCIPPDDPDSDPDKVPEPPAE